MYFFWKWVLKGHGVVIICPVHLCCFIGVNVFLMLLCCLFMSVELVVMSPLMPNVSDLLPYHQLARLYLLPQKKKS